MLTFSPPPFRFFKEYQHNDSRTIVALGCYHPYWINREARIRNPAFDQWSDKILDLKKDEGHPARELAIQFFIERLASQLASGYMMAVVPSSDSAHINTGIRCVAQRVACDGRGDATASLVRHTSINKLAQGGDRSIEIQLASIHVAQPLVARGQAILLLDDVTTTGNSLWACAQLLYDAGARIVQCVALGKTTHSNN